jgi:hypothetical protein
VAFNQTPQRGEREIQLLYDALAAAEQSGNEPVEASVRLLLSNALNMREATREVERATAIGRRIGLVSQTCFGLRMLAGFRLDRDPHDRRAFRLLDQALEIARRAGDREQILRGLWVRAHYRGKVGDRPEAIADWLAALDYLELMRDLQGDEVVRAEFFSRWAYLYFLALDYVLSSAGPSPAGDDLELAFALAER